VNAVSAGKSRTLALAEDGSRYAWGNEDAAKRGALGLGPSVSDAGVHGPTPQRLPALLETYGI
jgi:alpha-tubulin suppressor-like RCC1 family protein